MMHMRETGTMSGNRTTYGGIGTIEIPMMGEDQNGVKRVVILDKKPEEMRK